MSEPSTMGIRPEETYSCPVCGIDLERSNFDTPERDYYCPLLQHPLDARCWPPLNRRPSMRDHRARGSASRRGTGRTRHPRRITNPPFEDSGYQSLVGMLREAER